MQKPALLLVDGPNNVGKDYFIDNLKATFNQRSPEVTVDVIKASSIVDPKQDLSPVRSYSHYETDYDRRDTIARSHMGILSGAVKTLRKYHSTPDKPGVCIISRYILSWLCYNVYPDMTRLLQSNTTLTPVQRAEFQAMAYAKDKYLAEYVFALQQVAADGDIQIKVINLDMKDVNGGLLDVAQVVQTLKVRAATRNDGKEFCPEWTSQLFSNYRASFETIGTMLAQGANSHPELRRFNSKNVRTLESKNYEWIYDDLMRKEMCLN